MPERRRLVDAVCVRCRRIVRREDVSDVDDDSVLQAKAEIVKDGLVPYDYFTDTPKVVTGHGSKCPARPA